MHNYRVSFFKLEKETNEKGKTIVTGSDYLGSVTLDDSGTGQNLTIVAKAFRHAKDSFLIADKVTVEQL